MYATYSGCPDLVLVGESVDIWYEESLPTFHEVCLRSSQHPRDHKIYAMFHGTSYAAAEEIIKHGFTRSKDGMLGKGVYVTRDIHKAMKYPLHNPRQVILKLRVNVGIVKKIDHEKDPLQKKWHNHGYDTAWVPPHCGMTNSGREEDCVYNPRRIKVVDIEYGDDDDDVRKLKHLLHPSLNADLL